MGLRYLCGRGAAAGLLLMAGLAAGGQAMAQSLEGSWSGGGSVQFATGGSEQARCKAFYSRASKDTYRLRATCATPSGKANQTATVHKVGENRYRGNFHNPDYDITGTIFVVVSGNSQNVRLTSSSGSAMFRLSR